MYLNDVDWLPKQMGWRHAHIHTQNLGVSYDVLRCCLFTVRPTLPSTKTETSCVHRPASDRDGSDSGADSDGDRDSEDRDRDEEDVLAKQAREREQAAVDITSAVLGAIVVLFAKEVVRDAVALAAPPKVSVMYFEY